MESMQFNGYDVAVLAVTLLFVLRGLWLGLLKQVVPLLALYLGYFAASQYHDELLPFLSDFSDNRSLVFFAAYVILFVVSYLVVALVGKLIAKLIQITITPWFDRVLGGFLGFAKALIIVVIAHMLIGATLSPENSLLKRCVTCPTLDQFSDVTRQIIRDEDIRSALKQQRPAIAIEGVRDILNQEKSKEDASKESTQ